MRKIVLTGGPCSGKSTTIRVVEEEFRGKIVIVPEVATILLSGGFPRPGKVIEWSEEWQAAFQSAILPLQRSFEDAYALIAKSKGIDILVCDRGILDGAAYTPGGIGEFSKKYGVNVEESLARYMAVIHLESLAVVDPEKYGPGGNDERFEPLSRAIEIEKATKEVWSTHSHRIIIDGRRGIEGKVSEIIGMIRFLLTSR